MKGKGSGDKRGLLREQVKVTAWGEKMEMRWEVELEKHLEQRMGERSVRVWE
jgi:hypothetical protein